MKRIHALAPLLPIIVVAAGGCTDVLLPQPGPAYLTITEIEVTNETDSGTLLEVEVHLYEWPSGYFLGCSGDLDGLAHVDRRDVVYYPDASFGRANGGGAITVDELWGLDLFVVVVEDDHEPCPVPTNEGFPELVTDDLIGVSPVFRGEDLDYGVSFGFGNVVWIALEGVL